MTEISACETRRPRELYVVLDGQDRCLWLRMTEIGICGTGQPIREVYVISDSQERCLDLCLVRLASSVQTFGWVSWLMSQLFGGTSRHMQCRGMTRLLTLGSGPIWSKYWVRPMFLGSKDVITQNFKY
jgi:hypothetical protein